MHDTKNDVRSACHCLSGWCWIQGDAPRISKKQIISIRIHRESMKAAEIICGFSYTCVI